VLRIWSPARKSDVYAGVRERTQDFKISLHGDGVCQAGLSSDFAARESTAIASLGGSRHQSRWTRATHVGSQFVAPLQFCFPESELRFWADDPVADPGVFWIPPPAVARSVIVSCGFSGQLLRDDKWPGQANGTHLLGTKCLPNGEKFWCLWQDYETTQLELSMLGEARELLRRPGMVHFSAVDETTPRAPRTLIFKEFPLDRTLVVLDAATPSVARLS
jgi:hypothetical protein